MARLIITGPAARDIEAAYFWWKENRSAEQADRWYDGINNAIQSLRTIANRCPLAPDLLALGLRQLLFGVGRRATHRIVFAINADSVIILRVRHSSQDALAVDDLNP
jgi:plasmid stabilization system protein ParE